MAKKKEQIKTPWHTTLSRKMAMWFVVVVAIPSLVLSVFSCITAYQRYYDTVVSDQSAMLSLAGNSVDVNSSIVTTAVNSIASEKNVISLFGDKNAKPYLQVKRILVDINDAMALSNALLIQFDGKIMLISNNENIPESWWSVMCSSTMAGAPDYDMFMSQQKPEMWCAIAPMYPEATVLNPQLNKNMLSYYRKIFNVSGETIGAVKCAVEPEKIFAPINGVDSTPGIDFNIYAVQHGKTIWSKNESAPQENIPDTVLQGKIPVRSGGRLYIAGALSVMNDTVLVMSMDTSGIFFRAALNSLPQMLITILMLALMFFTTLKFSSSLKNRIKHTVTVAEKVKAEISSPDFVNRNITFPDDANDEMSVLIDTFNTILTQMQIYAKEKIAREKNEKDAIRVALQYQMNPHFLFNTLNWLQMCIEMDADRDRISEGIVLLGKLLRYNLDAHSFATVQQEVECAGDYISLMNMRKKEEIHLAVDCSIPQDTYIMRFLLQPLCENAIQHGLIPGKALHIKIEVFQQGNVLHVRNVNDGQCIPAETLDLIRQKIANNQRGNGVGLSNINERMKLLYGNGAEMKVTSDENETCIELHFPLTEGD